MTWLAEVQQTASILDTYSVSITEDNCKAMCLVETGCVAAAHSASSCQLYSAIELAEYVSGTNYFVKDCPGGMTVT